MKRWLVSFLGLCVVMLGHSAHAQVACGDTIEVDTVLDADLFCTGLGIDEPALTVVGPAKLDLDGHQVQCNDCFDTIRVEGRKARVISGLVGAEAGRAAVVVAGEGGHLVWNLDIDTGMGNPTGIKAESDRNRIQDNDIQVVFFEGILVTGARNRVDGNAISADGNGIVIEGPQNHVTGNDVLALIGFGIRMTQDAQRTLVTGNMVSSEPDSDLDGIVVETDRNLVANNLLQQNERGVVVVDGAHRNLIVGNHVSDSEMFDLLDGNPGCDDNRWVGNLFESANQACIDGMRRHDRGRHRPRRGSHLQQSWH